MASRIFLTCASPSRPARSILPILEGGRGGRRVIPFAFDSLGRMHQDSAKLFHETFITNQLESTKKLLQSGNVLGVGWAKPATRLRLLQYNAPAVSLPAPYAALSAPATLLSRYLCCCISLLPKFSKMCMALLFSIAIECGIKLRQHSENTSTNPRQTCQSVVTSIDTCANASKAGLRA